MESPDIEQRIRRLERELSRAKTTTRLTSIALLGIALASWVRPTDDTLRLKRLEIVDGEGRPRIVASAEAAPRVLIRSAAGQDQVRLGIGGEDFPFGVEEVPHLALETGQTRIMLSVSPAPTSEGLEERIRVESAVLQMSSWNTVAGTTHQKGLIAGVYPNKANVSIFTYDPKDPAASAFDPGVKLFVNDAGEVTTKLGSEQKK